MKQRGIKGETQRKYKNWIRQLYETQGPGTPFTLREMMEACGKDFDGKRDYHAAARFMMKMRRDFATVMQMFFASDDYDKYKAAKLKDPEMFRKLIDAALSVDVYPVWADPEGQHKYKLFVMASFVYLMEVRARSIVKEVERKAEVMALAFSKMPELREFYARPVLKGDGVLVQLPPSVECPVCGEHFSDPVSFVRHYNEKHPDGAAAPPAGLPPDEPPAPSTCPDCGGSLGRMERGDYICRECKTIFDKDKIATMERIGGGTKP